MKWSEVGQSLKAKLSLLLADDETSNFAAWALEATRAVAQ